MVDQNFKFCINCGSQISISDNFCPNCGSKQPAKQLTKQPQSVPESIPVERASGLDSDFNYARIMVYRRKLGFIGRPSAILYVQNKHFYNPIERIAEILAGVSFIVCFEQNGLLFLAVSVKGLFSGKNCFIKNECIQEFSVRTGLLENTVSIKINDTLIKFSTPKLLVGHSWQAQGFRHLKQKNKNSY
ncbi:MAG: zinc-ribbon domain-containing protein [Lentilactobacillus diolivorans]|nr:zinc-ribbon domain-containing protein [Lentilactobacillus diolivorans]RRG03210.1 MAG: zinc-ribbon domain-containing protein [Lactobacillus sp.]